MKNNNRELAAIFILCNATLKTFPPTQALLWLQKPHEKLGGRSPLGCLESKKWTDKVFDLLWRGG